MNKIWVALALTMAVFLTGCSGLSPVEKEKYAVYKEQKKREAIDRAQRETDAAGRRLEKEIKSY